MRTPLTLCLIAMVTWVGSAPAATLTFVSDTPEPSSTRPFREIAVSLDGKHVYAGSDGFGGTPAAWAVFSRDVGTGALSFVELETSALYRGTFTESPDGEHVYLHRAFDLFVYDRDTTTGELTYIETVSSSVNGSTTLSPDGLFLYQSGSMGVGTDGIGIYSRDPVSGSLSLLDTYPGIPSGVGTQVMVSADGSFLYSGNSTQTHVFERDAATGAITFVQKWKQGGTVPVAFNDEQSVLYTSWLYALARDAVSGKLSYHHELRPAECEPVIGTATSDVQLHADGARLFSQQELADSVVITGIDAASGALEPLETLRWAFGDLGAIDHPEDVALSPDGAHFYIATLARTVALYDVGASPAALQRHCLLEGRSLSIKSAAGGLKKSAKVVTEKQDVHLPFGVEGSSADPTCNGDPPGTARATLRFRSVDSGEDTGEIPLPCERWASNGSPTSANRGYQYKDPKREDGPCKLVKLQGRKLIKALCDNKALPFEYDLALGVDQGVVDQTLTIGNITYCTAFDDHKGKDGSDGRKFLGRSAPAPSACP